MFIFKVNFVFDIKTTPQFSAFERYLYLGVILNCNKNTQKHPSIVNSSQFLQADKDSIAYNERIVQKTLQKNQTQNSIIALFKNISNWIVTC